MVNVIFDERKWRIRLELDNEDCPYLYYPSNIHGCRISKNGEGECTLENCPLRIPSTSKTGA
jgi:hypothetical protein